MTDAYPRITLHWLEVSRSQRILWLLEELRLPYELKTWKRNADKTADEALRNIHPLGHAPILTIETPQNPEPTVLIESGNISEYLCDYYGKALVPTRYVTGKEGKIGYETESWKRYRTYMHYAEASIMPVEFIYFLMQNIKSAPVPFFVRPITNGVADKMIDLFCKPNFKTHYEYLESQLATSPDNGSYLCGKTLTAADIMMSFPLQAARKFTTFKQDEYPRMWEYIKLMEQSESWKRAVKKIEAVEGVYKEDM